jgi:lipoprotein NlpI
MSGADLILFGIYLRSNTENSANEGSSLSQRKTTAYIVLTKSVALYYCGRFSIAF